MERPEPTESAAVLLVEDDDDLRFALADLVRSEGFEVVVADGVEIVRTRWRERRYHAAILDAHLSEGSVGAKLAGELHRSDPATLVVVMTGDDAVEVPRGVELLAKPFGTRRLLELLRRPPRSAPA